MYSWAYCHSLILLSSFWMRNNGRKGTCKQVMEAIKVQYCCLFILSLISCPLFSSSFLLLPPPHFLPTSIFLFISPLSPLLFPSSSLSSFFLSSSLPLSSQLERRINYQLSKMRIGGAQLTQRWRDSSPLSFSPSLITRAGKWDYLWQSLPLKY